MPTRPSGGSPLRTPLMVAGLMALAGAPIAGIAFGRGFLEARDSEVWPAVRGRLVRAEIYGDGPFPGRPYRVDLRYEYWIDGRHYVGTRLHFTDRPESDRKALAAKLERLTLPAASLSVHHDPADPSRSVLIPGPSWEDLALLAVPPLLLLVGGSLLGLAYLARGPHEPADPEPEEWTVPA